MEEVAGHRGLVHREGLHGALHALVAGALPHVLDCERNGRWCGRAGGLKGGKRGRSGMIQGRGVDERRRSACVGALQRRPAGKQASLGRRHPAGVPSLPQRLPPPPPTTHTDTSTHTNESCGDVGRDAGLPLLLAPQLDGHLLARVVQPAHKADASPGRRPHARARVAQPQLVTCGEGGAETSWLEPVPASSRPRCRPLPALRSAALPHEADQPTVITENARLKHPSSPCNCSPCTCSPCTCSPAHRS